MPPEGNAAAETIEVMDRVETPEQTAPQPTRDALKEAGWTAEEMEKAEKRGMISTPEQQKKQKDEAEAKAKADAEAKAKAEAEDKAKTDGEILNRRAEDKETNHVKGVSETKLTKDQERVLKETFGEDSTPWGLYLGQKTERKARQAAERALNDEREARKRLEERIAGLENKGEVKRRLVDEEGNEVDPDDLPLTPKRLKELQAKEAEERAKEQEALDSRAKDLATAHVEQENYCREMYEDFDATTELTKDLIKNLDTLIPNPAKRAKIRNMALQLKAAALNADKIDLDEYHAGQIAYEIGQMHPKYGEEAEPSQTNGDASESDGKSKDPKKVNGNLTPEQMKRIEENTQRRASSASVSGGGGKRTISVDDVDAKTLNSMSYTERQRFKEKFPDRYAKLLRG